MENIAKHALFILVKLELDGSILACGKVYPFKYSLSGTTSDDNGRIISHFCDQTKDLERCLMYPLLKRMRGDDVL